MLIAVTSVAQVKSKTHAGPSSKQIFTSPQLREFSRITLQAGVLFTFPAGFKETRLLNSEDFPFDYPMEIPGHEFEIWLMVKSQKKDWQNYIISKNDPAKQTPNPDSSYIALVHAQAISLAADTNWINRKISPDVLDRYHANAGKSYLISLPDRNETKHYKYALLMAIEKDHTGTILAVCFTNDKNSEFFKNVSGMSQYIRFVEKL